MIRALAFVLVGGAAAPAAADDAPYTPPAFLAATPALPAGVDAAGAWRLDLAETLRIALRPRSSCRSADLTTTSCAPNPPGRARRYERVSAPSSSGMSSSSTTTSGHERSAACSVSMPDEAHTVSNWMPGSASPLAAAAKALNTSSWSTTINDALSLDDANVSLDDAKRDSP